MEAQPGAPKVHAVRDQLLEVLGHLLRNAIQASQPGGAIALRVAPDPAGGGVRLEVGDQGEGIPEEILARIFEPFFTTRGSDRAAGLGLLVCQRLVTDHGGTIEVRSREGEGTTFCVRLPVKGPPGAGSQELDPPAPDC